MILGLSSYIGPKTSSFMSGPALRAGGSSVIENPGACEPAIGATAAVGTNGRRKSKAPFILKTGAAGGGGAGFCVARAAWRRSKTGDIALSEGSKSL
jgi:hypothetical protein